jgi:hypothetical protein
MGVELRFWNIYAGLSAMRESTRCERGESEAVGQKENLRGEEAVEWDLALEDDLMVESEERVDWDGMVI